MVYPEAKATIVTELLNQEVVLLATKMPLVLAMKLPFSRSIDRTSPYGCGFSSPRLLEGVVQMTAEDNIASSTLIDHRSS